MSPFVVEEALAPAPGRPAPENSGRDPNRRGFLVETWLHDHANFVAIALILAGLGLRIYAATRTYLNPDEALHYLMINQRSMWLAYKASLSNAHPPLIYLVVYVWRYLGRSELMLRFPSLVAGTAFCWFAFKWMGTLFGKAAGLIGLVICAFSPALVSLSAELRAYALLLFCMGAALYFLARAFQETSARKMWCFSVFLYLAILSHYSALFFTVAAGLYALARFADSKSSQKLILPWAIGQAGALAIYGLLFVTHVSKIKNSIATWGMSFVAAYYQPSGGNIFTFTGQNTLNIFMFLFGQRYLAGAMLMFFAAGSTFLFIRDLLSQKRDPQLTRSGILLLFPFLAVWGAAVAGIYPYVGSRHTVFLAPFAIAGVSYLLAAISGRRIWVGLLVAVALMAYSNIAAKPIEPEISRGNISPAMMASAVSFMHHSIPQGDHIMVDLQSFLPLTYYFCGPRVTIPMRTFEGQYFVSACNGNPIISLPNWKLIAPSLPMQFEKMARDNGLQPGNRVWLYQTGWGETLDADLSAGDSRFRCLAPNRFGDGIAIIPFVVGPDFQPAVPPGDCATSPNNR